MTSLIPANSIVLSEVRQFFSSLAITAFQEVISSSFRTFE